VARRATVWTEIGLHAAFSLVSVELTIAAKFTGEVRSVRRVVGLVVAVVSRVVGLGRLETRSEVVRKWWLVVVLWRPIVGAIVGAVVGVVGVGVGVG
jgi:hypothetical protein